MRRLTTGPTRIYGRIGNLTAWPWRPPRHLLNGHPQPLLSSIPCAADEIVLGQGLEDGDTASSPLARTVLSGRIELPTGGGSATGSEAVNDVERFLDERGVDGLRSCRGHYCLAHLTRSGDTFYLYHGLTTSRGLYYRICRDGLVLSTDPEDLCDPDRPLYQQVNTTVMAALALETPVPDDASWYDGIRRLPAGYLLAVGRGGVRIKQYDDLRINEPTRIPFSAAASTFRELCSAAVGRAVVGVPTCAVQLSGGLDSAIVAFEAHRQGQTLRPFHFHYDLPAMADEHSMAAAVAAQCGWRLETIDDTTSLGPGGKYLLPGLPARTPLTHGFVNQHLASFDALAALPGPRRLLSGVGGDELLSPDFMTPLRTFGWSALNPLRAGGPPWQLFDNDAIRQLLGRSLREPEQAGLPARVLAAARVVLGTAPMRKTAFEPTLVDGVPWLTTDAMSAARAVGNLATERYAESFAQAHAGVKRTWLEMYWTYVTFHHAVNDYYMAASQCGLLDTRGIEYVAPMLDRDLFEFSLTLNTRYREVMHRGHRVQKAVMRAAYADLLPHALLGRLDKVDYTPPNEAFVLNNKNFINDLLGPDSRLAELGIIEPRAVRQTLDQPTWQTRRTANELVQTTSLELWLRGCDRLPHQPLPAIEPSGTTHQSQPQAVVPQPLALPGQAKTGAWRPTPDAVIRFLADEAVLLNEREFKVYRLGAASADLLATVLNCGNWSQLEAALGNGDAASTERRLENARTFVASLISTGLITGPTPGPKPSASSQTS